METCTLALFQLLCSFLKHAFDYILEKRHTSLDNTDLVMIFSLYHGMVVVDSQCQVVHLLLVPALCIPLYML